MKPLPAPLIALHQLSLYNTGRMSPEQIVAAFAARRSVLDRIIGDLTAEKKQSRAQHHLIVGQRGMGKTMLLARIAAELRINPELDARFSPLVFAEEQYAVDRLSKFWLNCLDSLADAREAAKDSKAVDEIDATVKRLTTAGRSAKDDQPFADEVYSAFAKAAAATGQRPVLLVDNLQLVFERLESGQQHSLRELLMRPGAPILVGASPSPPPQSQDYGAAFYDHFKVHYLHSLEESEMRDLLLHLAKAAQREDVRQRVLQNPARLKVLRQLTGGNPRTTLTLFFLYAEDFAPSVFGDLEGLLDRVTPLYKARFEELTTQQQVITSAIANHWDPVTAATLVEATTLPAGTISAQLDRLEKTGTIERVELFGESRTGYQIAERFFNIWFLMRSASRRQRREVEFLTRFLENFYEPHERNQIACMLMREDRFSPDRFLWSRAVAGSLTEPETAEELKRHTEIVALREAETEARRRMHELIDFNSLPPATLAFDDLRKKLTALVPANAGTTPAIFAQSVLGDRTMFMNGERERLAARTGNLSQDELNGVLEAISTSQSADISKYSKLASTWFSERLAKGQLRHAQDVEDWNRAFHQANGKDVLLLMVDSLPNSFGEKLDEISFDQICSAIRPKSDDGAWSWFRWGYYLHIKLARYAEAETAYREAIARDPKNALYWVGLGIVLQNHLERYTEAETAYNKAVARNPKDALAWNQLGHLLQFHLQRYAEAENAYKEAIRHDPKNVTSWNSLGNLYCDILGKFSEAIRAYDEALRFAPSSDIIHQNRLFLRRDFMGEGTSARPLMDELMALPKHELTDTNHLHAALFAAYNSNWGIACGELEQALAWRKDGLSTMNTDDWLRASTVLIHLNYGAELLALLDERGDAARLRPWVEAVRALQLGDRRALQNLAPEIRLTAETLYDGMEHRLKQLPAATSRRPTAQPKRSRKRRA